MSCDCDKPTLTFPSGAYNATQVRLYGIKQRSSTFSVDNPTILTSADGKIVTTVGISEKIKADKKVTEEINKLRTKGETEEDIYMQVSGIEESDKNSLSSGYFSQIYIDLRKPDHQVDILVRGYSKTSRVSCGVVVGYAYEGHCYDLPKPKIMLIPTLPQRIPFGDCAYHDKYDPKAPDKYMLWIVDKLDECVEFEMNQGFVEQIVLEANLPGKRSPTMYASRMMMGHRGGRLGE